MKKLLIAVLFAPLVALAQTYPSPTFQNITVNGTSTFSSVALTGGSINGTSVGATTPSTGAFTTLSSNGLASFSSLAATAPNPTIYYNQGGTGAVNRTFTAKMQDSVSVKDLGAACNGSTDDSAVFASSVASSMTVPAGSADCVIATNTTVAANLTFTGGVITVNSGVTLTLNGDVIAPHKVIFQGAGTVVINRGTIDVAWFDGSDASAKTAFALRGVSNTNGTGKTLAYYPPQASDAWATTSPNNQWGYCWNVTAPIDLEQAQAYTAYLTYSCFDATASMDSVFLIGNGTYKADGQNFPLRLKIDGGNGLASWAMRVRGASHLHIAYMEAYYTGGIAFTPNGSKQVSDVQIGFLDTGALYNQAILMDGSTGSSNTITDIDIGFVNSTGFTTGHAADSVIKIGSNTNAITVHQVSHRAVVAGFVDASQAVVLVTNGGGAGSTLVSPRYGIKIGPVINGSTTQTAQSVQVSDGSIGASAKMTGITIEAGDQNDTGSPPGGASISLNYTSGAIVQGLPMASSTNTAQKVTVNSTCVDTKIYGVNPSQVNDGGIGTLIDGRNYSAITTLTPGASPWTWTNNLNYPVDFWAQASTAISASTYTRGSGNFPVPINSNTVLYTIAPGDNIAISYTGTLTAKYLPR
jgi:hypothetical protein